MTAYPDPTPAPQPQAPRAGTGTALSPAAFAAATPAQLQADLADLVRATDAAVVVVDAGLRIRWHSPGAASVFALTPDCHGRGLAEIRHGLAYPGLGADVAAAVASRRGVEREVGSDDGRTLLVRITPSTGAPAGDGGAMLTVVDATRLRAAEDRALRVEDDMRIAMRRSSDFAVIAADPDGIITGWNSGAQAIFGWTADEIAGRTISVIFTPEDREAGADVQEMETARITGRAEDNRWHLRRDGSRVYCSGVMTPASVEGLRGYVKIARDVTSQQMNAQERDRQLDQARLRRANAEAAMALKDEFLAVMSHELKHPLNLIRLNAEILSRLLDAHVAPEPGMTRAMDALKHAVHAQARIIDDLLDLSRVRTGKLALERVAVDLVTLVGDAVEALAADGPVGRFDLRFDPVAPSILVHADIARLHQVVWNLLSNATKFTPAGGRIDVRVSLDGDEGRLDVVDSGQGVDPAFLPRVFDMFGQGEARDTLAHGGLGIGLALVKQLAEHHGGRVEAASDGIGKGARFSVWLPRHAPTEDTLPLPAPLQRDGRGLRLLVVDDDPVTVESLRVLLEMEGARVAVATSAAQALRAAADEVPDVVLTDIGMPHMDGFHLLAALRASPGLATLPVIALTGFGRHVDVARTRQAGFSAHVPKPVDLALLWERIADVVSAIDPVSGGALRRPVGPSTAR